MNSKFFSFEWFPLLTTILLHDRISWSIRLRWLAVGGFFIASLVIKYVFALPIPYDNIWILLAVLAAFNVVYYLILKSVKEFSFAGELIVLHVHILVDLICLTLIIHYCGGLENPLYLFYVFHVVISGIMFPGFVPIFFATLVVLMFSGIIFLEHMGYIPHYHIYNTGIHENTVAIFIILSIFIITVYISAYICMTFMQAYRHIKRQIDEQNRELIELDRQKSSFFRFSSHELKSPIIAIKSTIDSVVLTYAGVLDGRAKQLLHRASLRATHMLEILKELLELSRNYTNIDEETDDRIDIHQLLDQVITEEHSYAEEKNIKLIKLFRAENSEIRGNRRAFEKVFRNLINNAVRYSNENGRVELETTLRSNNLIVSVKDNGIGIPEADLPKVFSEFYRAGNARKVISFGTGLGLSLVKKIIEEYGGRVQVDSTEGKGTTFTISLPRKSTAG